MQARTFNQSPLAPGRLRMLLLWFLLATMLVSCTGVPDGVEPVSGFDKDRYLGKWHEIARLDHSFEPAMIMWQPRRMRDDQISGRGMP